MDSRPPKYALLLILALAAFARLHPLFLGGFIDPDSYYHARMTGQFLSQGSIPAWDALSYGGRPYTYYPLFHTALAGLSTLLGVGALTSLALFGILAGLASVLAMYALAHALIRHPRISSLPGTHSEWFPLLAAFSIAVLPAAVARSMAYSRADALVLALLPLLVLLFLHKLRAPAFLFGLLLALFHLPSALVIAGLLTAMEWLDSPRELPLSGIACSVGALSSLAYYARFPLAQYFSPAIFTSTELASLDWTFLLFYLSVFLVFALAGAWELRRSPPRFLAAWLILSSAGTLYATRTIVFLAPAFALLAGFGWTIILVRAKNHAGLFLAFTLVLATFAFTLYSTNAHAGVAPADARAARFLSLPESGGSGTVASLWDRGHMLAYYGNRPAFMDGYFEFSPQPLDRLSLVQAALSGSPGGLSTAAPFIRYVFLDSNLASIDHSLDDSFHQFNSPLARIVDSPAKVYELREYPHAPSAAPHP